MTPSHPHSNDLARARLPVDLMAGRRLADVPVATTAVAREPGDGVSCRLGDASCAAAHAARLDRSTAPDTLLRLQRQFGNRYVGRVLARATEVSSDGPAHGADDRLAVVERTIDQARGTGQSLDHRTRGRMETAFGADFGGVRIHTDTRADGLNHALSARAFATGRDVFFRQGEYDPGSSRGRELLAHELTHVVQQTGTGAGPQAKMTVSEPDDPQEREADEMARRVMRMENDRSDGGPNAVADPATRYPDDERERSTPLARKSESVALPQWGTSFFNSSNMQLNAFARLSVDGAVLKDDWDISSSKPASFKVPRCARAGEVQIIVGGTWFQNNSFGNLSGQGTATMRAPFEVSDKGELHVKLATADPQATGFAAQMTASAAAADNPPRGASLAAQVAIVANDQKGATASAGIIGLSGGAASGNSFGRGYRADVLLEKKEPVAMNVSQSVFFAVGKHAILGSRDGMQPSNIRQIHAFLLALPADVRKDLEDGTGDRSARIEVLAKASVTTPVHPGAGSNVELAEKRRNSIVRLVQDFLGGPVRIKARAVGELEASDPGESDAERVGTITVSWSDDPCQPGTSQAKAAK